MWTSRIILLTLCVAVSRSLHAELPVPELSALSQPVLQIGTEARIAVHGARLEEIRRAMITDDGRITDVIQSNIDMRPDFPGSSAMVSTGKLDFVVPSTAKPGLVDVQLLGRFGLSNARRLLLTSSPVRLARVDNGDASFAEELVTGTIYVSTFAPRARRYFRVRVRSGEKLQVVVYARQLDSRAMPTLQVLSADGEEVARSRGVGDWPAECLIKSDRDQEYLLVLHDFLFRGGVDYGFALQVSVSESESPNGSLELDRLLRPTQGLKSIAKSTEQGGERKLPLEVTGVFGGSPIEYDFHAEKGQQLSIEVVSQRVGQLTDPDVVLYSVTESNDKQQLKQLVYQDDGPSMGNPAMRMLNRDPVLTWAVPADGLYRAALRDQQSGRRPTDSRRFQLRVVAAVPELTVHAFVRYPHQNPVVSRHAGESLRPGGTVAIGLLAQRKGGFDGPVEISAAGLPSGVSCPAVVIASGATESTIVIEAEEDAEPWTGTVGLEARALGDQAESVVYSTQARTVTFVAIPTWNTITHRPAEALCISLANEDPAPLTLSIAEGNVVEAAAGQTIDVPIKLKRRSGAAANCILRAHDLPPGFVCPDVTIDGKAAEAVAKLKVPPNASAGEYTFRMLCETKLKWKSNIQSLQRLEAHIAELSKQVKSADGDARKSVQALIDSLQAELGARKKASAEQELTAWLSTPTIRVRVSGAK